MRIGSQYWSRIPSSKTTIFKINLLCRHNIRFAFQTRFPPVRGSIFAAPGELDLPLKGGVWRTILGRVISHKEKPSSGVQLCGKRHHHSGHNIRSCFGTRGNLAASAVGLATTLLLHSSASHHHHRHLHHPHHLKMVDCFQIANDCKSILLFPRRRKFSIDQNLTDVSKALSKPFSSSRWH